MATCPTCGPIPNCPACGRSLLSRTGEYLQNLPSQKLIDENAWLRDEIAELEERSTQEGRDNARAMKAAKAEAGESAREATRQASAKVEKAIELLVGERATDGIVSALRLLRSI